MLLAEETYNIFLLCGISNMNMFIKEKKIVIINSNAYFKFLFYIIIVMREGAMDD